MPLVTGSAKRSSKFIIGSKVTAAPTTVRWGSIGGTEVWCVDA